jgi:hypothetical protein
MARDSKCFCGYEEKTETGNGLFLDDYDSKWKSGTYERTYSEAVLLMLWAISNRNHPFQWKPEIM